MTRSQTRGTFILFIITLATSLWKQAGADDAGQALNNLCKRLEESLPRQCSCQARISLLENYFGKNGIPKSLRPVVSLTLGPGEKAEIEMKMPPLLGGASRGLTPGGGNYEGAKEGSPQAFIDAVVGTANPRALAARLRRLSRRASTVELSKVQEGGQAFSVLDFRDTFLPASAIGHLLRLKLWIGQDGAIHRARLYTSLHGILDVRVKYGEFVHEVKKYRAASFISITPMLSEYQSAAAEPIIFNLENYTAGIPGDSPDAKTKPAADKGAPAGGRNR